MKAGEESELAELLRTGLAGDERAYGEFLRQAASIVRGFARRRIAKDGIDAEDVVQETLLALHVKRHTWNTDAPVKPWLYAIARHKLIDAFRRRGEHINVELDEIAETLAAPEPENLTSLEIDRALAMLAPGQRTVVAAISVEGQSIGEAAKRLGMSEAAVRVSLHRGLRAIAKRFGRN